MKSLSVLVAYKLGSPANAKRGSSRLSQSRRKSTERQLGMLAVSGNRDAVPVLPVTVTIVRIAPRALDDDNLAYAAKAIRDGVADGLGVRDNDPRVSWRYEQRKPAKGCKPAVEIRVEART